ncbi:hypothetical protein ACTG9Q_15375 [Actinokineospora sp. 24-640]
MHRSKTALTAIAVATGLLVGACGKGDGIDGLPVPTGQAESTAEAGATGAESTEGSAESGPVSLRTGSGELGTIITDGGGMTLYRFDTDTAKPPNSTCEGECASAWPPVLVDNAAALDVEGIDEGLLGSVGREDGQAQLTVAGWPAYYYSKDTEPGDVKGQGAGGKWFAFTAEGKKAATPAPSGAVADVRLAVMPITGLGNVVTDREGMTLYRFDKDESEPSRSTCDGGCAEKWPPVLVPEGAEVVVDGLDKADVGVVERSDGTRQATVGGWPLYRFAGDKVPCDTNGQGVGDTWFAAAPDGKKAGA